MNILRMMAVHNEADIVEQNIDWYHQRGFQTVAIDNVSTDGSYEICERALRAGKLVGLGQIETDGYEWDLILSALFRLAKEKDPDWFMLSAPDEFFETSDGADLLMAINADICAGYNLIKFFNMEFWMTAVDDRNETDVTRRMRHYSCYDVDMFRAFPNVPGVDLVANFGHRPVFPADVPVKESPRVYVSRHYKIRSADQGLKKIERIRPTARLPNANNHYQRFSGEPSQFLIPASRLHRYDDDHVWQFDCVFNGNRAKRGIAKLDDGYWGDD